MKMNTTAIESSRDPNISRSPRHASADADAADLAICGSLSQTNAIGATEKAINPPAGAADPNCTPACTRGYRV